MRVQEEMKQRGLSLDVAYMNYSYMVLSNGYKLSIKSSTKPTRIGNREYYRINYAEGSTHKKCDFIICRCGTNQRNTQLIIPSHIMP